MIETNLFINETRTEILIVNLGNGQDIWAVKKAYQNIMGETLNVVTHMPTTAELIGINKVFVIYDNQDVVSLSEQFTSYTQEVYYLHEVAIKLPEKVRQLAALVPYIVNHYVNTMPVADPLRLEWEELLSDISQENME